MRSVWIPVGLLALVPLTPPTPAEGQGGATLNVDDGWTPGPPAPAVAAYRLDSSILGEERRVYVALPPSYERTSRAYPLVLVFDGEAVLAPVLAAAGALTAAGHMPEAVIVGVENTDRLRDLSPPGIAVSGNDGRGQADRLCQVDATRLGVRRRTQGI